MKTLFTAFGFCLGASTILAFNHITEPKTDVLEEAINSTHVDYCQEELEYCYEQTEGNKLIELCTDAGYFPTKYIYLEPTNCNDSQCNCVEAYDEGYEEGISQFSSECR